MNEPGYCEETDGTNEWYCIKMMGRGGATMAASSSGAVDKEFGKLICIHALGPRLVKI